MRPFIVCGLGRALSSRAMMLIGWLFPGSALPSKIQECGRIGARWISRQLYDQQ